MKTKLIPIVLFLVLVCSCQRTLPDEDFTMERTPYTGKKIRLDGCYVSDPFENKKYCEYNFFYSNGIVLSVSDYLNIENINQFTAGIDKLRSDKGSWGIFYVENDTIFEQTWGQGDFTTQYIVYKRFYKIINDTTLSYNLYKDGRPDSYSHFKKFSSNLIAPMYL